MITLVVLLFYLRHSLGASVYRLDPVVVVEEPPIGTLVVDLASPLGIADALGDFKFRFYSPQSLAAHYFLVDALTGHVKTQRTLDREYLCETKACGPCAATSNCTLPVEIVVARSVPGNKLKNSQQQQQQKFVSFDVLIEDKNEFAPKFPRDIIYLNVSETAPANFSIPLEAAIDRDSTPSPITYSIEPDMVGKLALSLYPQLSLVVVQPLDYEIEKELRFKIIATDGGSSSNNLGSGSNKALSSSCSVVLRVLDINDNLPQFDRDEYEYRLEEDRAIGGTKLIRVHASDRDDGENGLVKYALVEQSASLQKQPQQPRPQLKNLFQIDELSGWISVSPDASLDYEEASTYRLVVRAQDSGLVNSMPVFANVLIYLNDINDNAPLINLTLPGLDPSMDDESGGEENSINAHSNATSTVNGGVVELSEYTSANTFVAQLAVSDADSGANGRVELDMRQYKRQVNAVAAGGAAHKKWVESGDFELVHLFKNIYSLMTKNALDRERFDEYRIELRARDAGQPRPLETLFEVRIIVKDENDNKPFFVNLTNADGYEFSVDEVDLSEPPTNEPILIGQVKAVDYDTEPHGTLTYSIDSVDFRIDEHTGSLWASSSAVLDRELAGTAYEFNVTADDGLNKETKRVRVLVADRNDNAPQFDVPRGGYRFRVGENRVPKQPLGVVHATDADAPRTGFSRVRYGLLPAAPSQDDDDTDVEDDDDDVSLSAKFFDWFRIDEDTGELTLLKELDYETVKTVKLKAIAYDNFNTTPSLNSTCDIEIQVENENDNKPKLMYPRDSDQPLLLSLPSNTNTASSLPPSDNSSTTTTTMPTTRPSRYVLTRVVAADLDAPPRLTYTLERQIRVVTSAAEASSSYHHQLELVNMFEMDAATGSLFMLATSSNVTGLYALIVEISDKQSLTNDMDETEDGADTDADVDESIAVVQKTRAYVFVALGLPSNHSDVQRLRDILNVTRLNIDDDDSESRHESSDYYEDDYSEARSQDFRFERVLNLLKQVTNVRLNRKKTNSGQRSSDDMHTKNNRGSMLMNSAANLGKLKNQLLDSLNQANYLPLLAIVIFSCVSLSVLFASLCILASYYNKRQQRRRQEADKQQSQRNSHFSDSSSSSSYYEKPAASVADKKHASHHQQQRSDEADEEETLSSKVSATSSASHHSSPNNHQQLNHHPQQPHQQQSSSSASPMSLVSAELTHDALDCVAVTNAVHTPSKRLVVKKRGNSTATTTTTTFMSTLDRSKI